MLPNVEGKHPFIYRYIQFSIHADDLLATKTEEWEQFQEAEEHKYVALIESEDWELLGEDDAMHSILIPRFCANKEMVWRWRI